MLHKHSKRTIRKPCKGCGTTDAYWAHDDERPNPAGRCSCGVDGAWILINKDGSRHDCASVAASTPAPSECEHRGPKHGGKCLRSLADHIVYDDTTEHHACDPHCETWSTAVVPPIATGTGCGVTRDGYTCTREPGHDGDHYAHGTSDGRRPWPNVEIKPETVTRATAEAKRPKASPRPIDGYYPRMVQDDLTDVDLLRKMRVAGHHVLLQGPPGTGKTALAMASHGDDLHTVVCSADTESADFLGQWTQRPDGTFAWHDGPAVLAALAGQPLFVDEVNLAPPSVLSSALYPLMDGRGKLSIPANPERGEIVAAPGFVVIGAANPNVPGGRFSEALLSRFTLHISMLTDWTLASSLGIPDDFVRVARNLDVKVRNNECEWSPQVRDGLAFKSLSAIAGLDFAWSALISAAPEDAREVVTSVVSAAVGKGVTALTLSSGDE